MNAAGDLTIEQLKQYASDTVNYSPPNNAINPIIGSGGIGGLIGKQLPFTMGPWTPGSINEIAVTPPEKEETIFKSEPVNGLYYELKAELRNDTVFLKGTIYSNDVPKEYNQWVVTGVSIQNQVLEAHKWAQAIVEKKKSAFDLFESLIEKGKKETISFLAMCMRKYIPS